MKNTDTIQTTHSRLRQAGSVILVVILVLMLAAAPASAQNGTGETTPCATGPPVPGQGTDNDTEGGSGELEIAFVNDDSGSMSTTVDGTSQTRLEILKSALADFIAGAGPDDEMAHVDIEATVHENLTADHEAVNRSIQNLQPNASVQLEGQAITAATDQLTASANATDGATKVIIYVADGEPGNPQEGIDAANTARENGITVFAVGIGDSVDDEYMIDVAGDESRYYDGEGDDLGEIYQQVQEDIEAIGGELEVDTRSLYQPGATHSYTVNQITYLSDNTTEVEDVTEEANVTTTNTSLLSVNESGHTLSATDDANTSTWVRVDATVGGVSGCTNVIVAQPTVENLELVPGIWRFYAVFADSAIFFLLLASLLSVPASRFASAFAGLGVAEMVIVVGWFAGYIPLGIMLLSVFTAIFIGLNLAENTVQLRGR